MLRALERASEGGVESVACRLEHGAGAMRLEHAFLGEVHVLPAGEAVQPVPLALAVADENEHIAARLRLFVLGSISVRNHGRSPRSTRRGGSCRDEGSVRKEG